VIPIVHGVDFERFYHANVLVSASVRAHRKAFAGAPLSVKSVLRGEASWHVGGRCFKVDRTSTLIVERQVPFELEVAADAPALTFAVFFADRLAADVTTVRTRPIERLLDDPSDLAAESFPIVDRLWAHDTAVPQAMRKLRAINPADTPQLDAQLRNVLDAFADLVAQVRSERERIQAARAATRAELHQRVLRGRAVLEDCFAEPFDLDAVAAEACLSPHHFHRTFGAAFGEAPYRYVARRRIERARRLLEETDLSVVDVCTSVGYESLPSFTSRFRRLVGVTPAAYREQLRNAG
jgi:AraC-like DNA-binding protein